MFVCWVVAIGRWGVAGAALMARLLMGRCKVSGIDGLSAAAES